MAGCSRRAVSGSKRAFPPCGVLEWASVKSLRSAEFWFSSSEPVALQLQVEFSASVAAHGATNDKIRVLAHPRAADKGNGLTHRFEFVTLRGGKWSQQIDLGMAAAVQKGRVATPKKWRGLEYRVDVGKDPRKVGATPTPVHPVRPSAPESAATSKVVPPAAGTWSTGAAYYKAYPSLPQTEPTATHNDAAYKQDLLKVRQEVQKMGLSIEKLLSSREADQKPEVPDEANTLLRQEMADLKEENGKLKEEQLRAAAAAEAAEATRLAQLAAQSQAHRADGEVGTGAGRVEGAP